MGQEAQALEQPFNVLWYPQAGPQQAFLSCPVFEVVYGGARGGGKTDGCLGDFAQHAQEYAAHASGVFFRRQLRQLDEVIERSKVLYSPLGAVFHHQEVTWKFPNGARLKFRPLERDSDAEKYQGHSYTRLYFEELTNYPNQAPVAKMKATLRSAAGVPVGFRASCNPGGPGHLWVKERYIDPAPGGYEIMTDDEGLERVFIPARVTDNVLLVQNDPTYIARLKQAGSKELVKAWLDGDWSVIEGAYFDCWDTKRHVVRPTALPEHWTRFRAMDWGFSAPFAVYWIAVSDGQPTEDGTLYPKNALVIYKEWYGSQSANIGLRLTAEEVAAGILARDSAETVNYSVCDPSMWSQDGGPSLAERMNIPWQSGDNKRLSGWDQVRARLVGEDGRPMLYVFSTCTHLIRTLPSLQHDEKKPEDLDTTAEDHAADAVRYGCMSRPYQAPPPPDDTPIYPVEVTINEMIKRNARRSININLG